MNSDVSLRRKLFHEQRLLYEEAFKTPLSVVICGSGPFGSDSDLYEFREAVKEMLKSIGDYAFYFEDEFKSEEGKRIKADLWEKIGKEPSNIDLEIEYLLNSSLEKNVHLPVSFGSISELGIFLPYSDICKKTKIFVDEKHKDSGSITMDVIKKLKENGSEVYFYSSKENLLKIVKQVLNKNRLNKYKKSYNSK